MQIVALACLQAGLKDLKLDRAQVDVELVFGRKLRLDVDNLTARCKPIFDALVNMGVLVDDSTEHMLPVISWQFSRERATFGPQAIVRIWDRSEA